MAKKVMRGGAMLAPVPAVMVSVGDEAEKNIITVAWCGTLSTTPPKTYISVRPSRHSYEIIKRTGEFVINLVPTSLAKCADYCGIYTGAKVDINLCKIPINLHGKEKYIFGRSDKGAKDI